MSKVAVLGYGTIGSGVVEVLDMNKALIGKKAGSDVEVKYVLDLREFPGSPIENILTHDFNDILNDAEVDIVVETMGGTKPAYDFVKQCLLAGKSVCSSNKELVEKHGPELIAIAKDKKVDFLFEASCGGGIPVIRPLISSYTADDVDEISGILNGTTNYILSKMSKEGQDYASALKKAQELGFAEKNPEADVEGYDPCRKIAILSSLVFEKNINFEDIYTEGITKISAEDIAYVNSLNMAIKLIASCRKVDGKYYAMVSPFVVAPSNPLYAVNDVFNAIFVHGNAIGDTMLYGSGAGKLPTASAVVADVVAAANKTGETCRMNWSDEKLAIEGVENDKRSFLVRVSEDKVSEALKVFGASEAINADGISGEAAVITEVMTEKEFAKKASDIGIISRLRIK